MAHDVPQPRMLRGDEAELFRLHAHKLERAIGSAVRETDAVELASGSPVHGYEIHLGRTSGPDCERPWLRMASGEPEGGLYVHWNRVCDHLADLNRFHKVVVHTVVYSDSAWYREQLEHIAKATGGSFTAEQ